MKALLLDQYVGKEILLKFKFDLQPQPQSGKLEAIDIPSDVMVGPDLVTPSVERFYKLLSQATMMDQQGNPKGQFILPQVFSAEDVLWISEGAITMEGESAIVTPRNGGRTPGGLHIPR